MSGTQIFWGLGLAAYVIFLVFLVNSGDGFAGICLSLISAGAAAVAGFFYAVARLVKWFSKGSSAGRELELSPDKKRKKALAMAKSGKSPAQAALLQFVHDAALEGLPEPDISARLQKKGWPPAQVAEALENCRKVLRKYPLAQK